MQSYAFELQLPLYLQCNLSVIEKELVVAPKFVERFHQGQVNEGETLVLQVRAVGTPVPQLSWQKDGVSILPSNNVQVCWEGIESFKVRIDFIVATVS